MNNIVPFRGVTRIMAETTVDHAEDPTSARPYVHYHDSAAAEEHSVVETETGARLTEKQARERLRILKMAAHSAVESDEPFLLVKLMNQIRDLRVSLAEFDRIKEQRYD